MPKNPPDKKHHAPVVHQQLIAHQFHGPIPPSSELAGYEQVLPGAADRLISMAEKEASHRHFIEKRSLLFEGLEVFIGQLFALCIGAITVIGGVYAAVHGAEIAGGIIGISGVTGLVSAFIMGRNAKKEQESPQNSNNHLPKNPPENS
jgi:uncharacterized membrane protein